MTGFDNWGALEVVWETSTNIPLVAMFALQHGMGLEDVRELLDLDLVQRVETVAGATVLMWAEGFTAEEAQAARRALQRVRRRRM